MSSVFEVAQSNYLLVTTPEWACTAKGYWSVPSKELPVAVSEHLVNHGGNFERLEVSLALSLKQTKGHRVDETPFSATLGISLASGKTVQLIRVERRLAVRHLWTNEQRDEGIRCDVVWPLPCSYYDFCRYAIHGLLLGVLDKPKALIRWDEQGMVVSVNFGNTYLSTREHGS